MKSVIFIAPPASGKGTQSNKLVKLGYVHISTGDMLRDEMKNETDIGIAIKDLMDHGCLVSDELVFELIKEKIINLDKPFILDGYPRTIKQAKMLNELLNNLDINDYEVIYLDMKLEEALKRALGRLTCECGISYNTLFEEWKPKVENICDKCGSTLVKRSDDNEESFKNRYNTFIKNNEPIISYYEELNKFNVIDTRIGDENITDRIKDILKWLV